VEATLADPDLTITLTWFPNFVDAPGTSTQLASESIKRGTVHQIRLQADTQSGNRKRLVLVVDEVLDSGIGIGLTEPTAVGHVTQVGISAAGLLVGHVAVYEFEPGTTLEPEARQTFAAIGGWDGERAVARIWRLSHEEGLQPDVVGRLVGRDTFTRVEADDWGTSDSGQEWEIRTTAEAFAVNGSAGTMTGQGTFAFEGAYFGGIFNKYSDVDLRFTADIDGDGDTGCFVRIQESGGSTVGWIQVVVRVDGGARSVWIFRVGVLSETLGTAGDPGPGPWRMRVVAAGAWIACKVWPVSGDEPDGWTIAAYDPAYSRGAVGLMHFGVGVTSTFDDFELYTMDDSTLCGPQSVDTLISVMDEAAKVEAGGGWAPILTERRDARGLRINARAALYNRPADLELDYQSGHISEPFEPLPDDRNAANDVTVTRQGGTSFRKVRTAGPLNISDPVDDPEGMGPVTRSLRLDLHSDGQVSEVAGWMLLHGTWDEERFPVIRD